MTVLFVCDKPDITNTCQTCLSPRLLSWIEALGCADFILVNRGDPGFFSFVLSQEVHGHPIVALGDTASHALGATEHFKLPSPADLSLQVNDEVFVADKLEKCLKYLKFFEV